MKKVGSNIEALLQIKEITQNNIGDDEQTWSTVKTLKGFLDYMAGTAEYANYNAKLQESTHVFICDYEQIPYEESQMRLVIGGKAYDVQLLDNPMELNYHLEFYLKYVGT